MARLDQANAVRAPSVLRSRAEGQGNEAGDGDDGRPRFRLVVTRGKLGVELERPFALGPLRLTDFALTIPDARFPVDVSGGIDAFRNRRGELERVALDVRAGADEWGLAVRGLFGDARPEVLVAPTSDGFLVGMRAGEAALAFEVVVVAADEDLRLVPIEARGVGLGAPPHALALAALTRVTKPFARRVGGVLVLERAAHAIAQELVPLAGMRVPATDGVRWSAPVPEVGLLAIRADREAPSPPSPRAIRAIEVAALAADADEALARGDLDEARRQYLAALERAPRHPELARRLAELDRCEGRAEVALGVLADLGPGADADVLAGELFAAVGDRDAAASAFERAAEAESYGALAAAAWQRRALLFDGDEATANLDRAIARAPGWNELRWERFVARLRVGLLELALADASELEANTRGAQAKHALAQRIGEHLYRERHLEPAMVWFERALRYRPDGAETILGLARALGALGQGRRALELHVRALGLAKKSSTTASSAHVVNELARALVSYADDRPAAIAHVRSVPALLAESFEARLLEGRWRAELGDLAGASEAFARLADEAERALGALADGPGVRGEPTSVHRFANPRDMAAAVASFLEEAARIEEFDRGDRLAAKRLLGLGLRLAPRRASIQAAFRRVATESDGLARATVDATPSAEAAPAQESSGAPSFERSPSDERPRDVFDPAEDELLVEQLSDKLRADPSRPEVVLALADALERLGRDHDLLALLSARIEEEGEPLRGQLLPRRRSVLERMRDAAAADGRDSEAELYELLLGRD